MHSPQNTNVTYHWLCGSRNRFCALHGTIEQQNEGKEERAAKSQGNGKPDKLLPQAKAEKTPKSK